MFAPDENGNTVQPIITIKQTDDTDSVNRATVKAGTVYSYVLYTYHRRRIKTEEKARVVAVGWGTCLNAAQTI